MLDTKSLKLEKDIDGKVAFHEGGLRRVERVLKDTDWTRVGEETAAKLEVGCTNI